MELRAATTSSGRPVPWEGWNRRRIHRSWVKGAGSAGRAAMSRISGRRLPAVVRPPLVRLAAARWRPGASAPLRDRLRRIAARVVRVIGPRNGDSIVAGHYEAGQRRFTDPDVVEVDQPVICRQGMSPRTARTSGRRRRAGRSRSASSRPAVIPAGSGAPIRLRGRSGPCARPAETPRGASSHASSVSRCGSAAAAPRARTLSRQRCTGIWRVTSTGRTRLLVWPFDDRTAGRLQGPPGRSGGRSRRHSVRLSAAGAEVSSRPDERVDRLRHVGSPHDRDQCGLGPDPGPGPPRRLRSTASPTQAGRPGAPAHGTSRSAPSAAAPDRHRSASRPFGLAPQRHRISRSPAGRPHRAAS